MENKETKRWHAKEGEIYYLVHHRLGACSNIEGNGTIDSDIDFISGSYFRTLEEAEQVSEEITKTLLRANNELRDFEWALQKMKEGLRVRRATFRPGLHIMLIDGQLYYFELQKDHFYEGYSWQMISSNNILAADWELYV